MRRLVSVLALLLPSAAAAHPQDLAYLDLRGQGDVVEATLDLGAPLALQLAQLPEGADLSPEGIARSAAPLFAGTLGSGVLEVEGQPCHFGAPISQIDGLRVQVRAAARCRAAAGRLRFTLPFVESTPPTFRIIGRAELSGSTAEFSAGPGREVVAIDGPPPGGLGQLLRGVLLLASPGAGLLCLVAALALALAGGRREARRATAVLTVSIAAGIALAQFGVALADRPLALAAGTGALALAIESAWIASPVGRWRLAAPAGLVLGLAAGPALHGGLAATGAAVGLVVAWVFGSAASRLQRWPRLARSTAALLALAAGASMLP